VFKEYWIGYNARVVLYGKGYLLLHAIYCLAACVETSAVVYARVRLKGLGEQLILCHIFSHIGITK